MVLVDLAVLDVVVLDCSCVGGDDLGVVVLDVVPLDFETAVVVVAVGADHALLDAVVGVFVLADVVDTVVLVVVSAVLSALVAVVVD